jgi:hypothetical protein
MREGEERSGHGTQRFLALTVLEKSHLPAGRSPMGKDSNEQDTIQTWHGGMCQ